MSQDSLAELLFVVKDKEMEPWFDSSYCNNSKQLNERPMYPKNEGGPSFEGASPIKNIAAICGGLTQCEAHIWCFTFITLLKLHL